MKTKYKKCMLMMLSLAAAAVVMHTAAQVNAKAQRPTVDYSVS